MVRHGASEARLDGRLVAADGTELVLTRVIPTYVTRRDAGGAVTDEWTRRAVPAARRQ